MDGYGVGDVGSVVLRDRKHLAEDGMVVVVLPCPPMTATSSPSRTSSPGASSTSRTRDLLKELQSVARDAAENVSRKRGRDDGELKGSVKSAVSSYLFKTTKRNPMVIPVVTRL